MCQNFPSGFRALVREFYANLEDRKETQCYVRGKWVSFHRKDISQVLKLGKWSDGEKFKELKKNPDFQKIVQVLTDGKGEWKSNNKNSHESIARGFVTEEAMVWFYFLSSTLMTTKHVSIVWQEEAIIFYVILIGYTISFGKLLNNRF